MPGTWRGLAPASITALCPSGKASTTRVLRRISRIRRFTAGHLASWSEEIACTEGFDRKMKLIQRRAYGFRNFNNYRLRVLAQTP